MTKTEAAGWFGFALAVVSIVGLLLFVVAMAITVLGEWADERRQRRIQRRRELAEGDAVRQGVIAVAFNGGWRLVETDTPTPFGEQDAGWLADHGISIK